MSSVSPSGVLLVSLDILPNAAALQSTWSFFDSVHLVTVQYPSESAVFE